MSIRVLLGTDDDDLANRLTGLFREIADIEVFAVEKRSDHVAGTVAVTPDLDVVLVHQGLGPLPALDLVRDLVGRHPELAVVIVAVDAGAELYAAAMAVGARGVVSADPTLAELQAGVRQAAEWSRTMRRHLTPSPDAPPVGGAGRLVTLFGAKGGTGTTTLAVHLALAATDAGRSVCLVDLDLQSGDMAGYLDVQHRHSIADLAQTADLDGAVVAEALFVHRLGPHLLLSPDRGEDAEEISARATRRILTLVRARYDLVIVDAGAHVGDANAIAVELADDVVVTATPDVPALRAARRLTRLWERLAIRREDEVSVVLTRQDRRNEIQPDLARKMVASPVREVQIPAAFRALEEAANTGAPRAVKNADFRKAVGRLARDLGALEPSRDAEPGGGDRGATAIQFAAIFPLVLLVGLLVWQVVLVGTASMYASHAANEAARAAAVVGYTTPQSRAEVRGRAVKRIEPPWSDSDRLRVDVRGEYAVVAVDIPAPIAGWRVWQITAKARIVDEGAAR
ncbi:AAA family ATPase [Actinomadura flavalba]|uniref:AAA family ATPase n=1 Tax=Actinomadura flavalba TaxID=1120938 RepID=UPI000373B0D3|nr:AAA family ATPase [Actinomadura flavalba]